MSSSSNLTHLPPVDAHERTEIGHELQATLAALIELALVGKQLHWTVTGPHFRALHEQLDELVDTWRALADTVAERAVAIGTWPDGQAATVAASSELTPLAPGAVEDHVAVHELARRLAEASERARSRMDRLGPLDAVSHHVLVGVVRELETQLWTIRAQLATGGGER